MKFVSKVQIKRKHRVEKISTKKNQKKEIVK